MKTFDQYLLEKNWIKKAINPDHTGFCTPLSKKTCTPKRKALALRFKKGDLHNESTEHDDQKELLAFFAKRRAGARKIAQEAKAKGGPSMLTYWHFKAKDAPYKEVIEYVKEGKNKSEFKKKWSACLSKVKGNLKQEAFQRAIGELEVWGEALCEIWKN